MAGRNGGRKTATNHSKDVEAYFLNNPDTVITIGMIHSNLGLNFDQVRGAITYLRAKAQRGQSINIYTLERGKRWRYMPNTDAVGEPIVKRTRPRSNNRVVAGPETIQEALRGVAEEAAALGPNESARRSLNAGRALNNPKPDWAEAEQAFHAVPEDEPLAQFHVMGDLVVGVVLKGTILKAASPGFSGNYLLTEL